MWRNNEKSMDLKSKLEADYVGQERHKPGSVIDHKDKTNLVDSPDWGVGECLLSEETVSKPYIHSSI